MNQPSAAPTRKVQAAAGGTFVTTVTALIAVGVAPTVAVAAALVLAVLSVVPAYLIPER